MLRISNLTVNRIKNPHGITETPRFGWLLESDFKNTMQTSYRLQIALNLSFLDVVYDSTDILDNNSVCVLAHNFTIVSAKKYYWRVQIVDNHQETSEWSEVAYFITGILKSTLWRGDFITAETRSDIESSKGTYVRGQFYVKGNVHSAFLYCTALGLYKPFINGNLIGNGELLPGWTSYNKSVLYQTYDISCELQQGDNMLGAMLGAGWYKGKMGLFGTRNNYGDRTAFYAMLLITYTDGRIQRFESDGSWQGADAPIIFAEIYDGEIYDASMELDDWCNPAHSSGNWKEVSTIVFDKDLLAAQPGGVVEQQEFLPVKQIITTPEGDTVLDFGQNLTGWVQFSVQGKAKDRVELNCFEVLDQDGNVYQDNLRNAKQSIIYYCRDNKSALYHPSFTFQGFRYVRVAAYPGEIKAENFSACVLHSDMHATGTFECSDPGVNQLHHNILWGMKGNFVDIPTDCPQRDERLGWTGDAQIFCRTATYLMDTYVFFTKWLKDLAADQADDGGVPHVVPDLITGLSHDWLLGKGTYSAAGWADAAVIIPWTLYQIYADKTVLEEQYASMKGWIDFMEAHTDDNGIWNHQLQFGDWVALDAVEGSYFGATPIELTNTAYYAYSTGLFAKAAEVLGKHEDAEKYNKLHDDVTKTFQRHFFDENGTMTVQTQTAHILALYFHLVPAEFTEQTIQGLIALLKKENNHLVTGFLGTAYFCQTLSDYNCVKEAYDLLLKKDFPSWLYQVEMGATTVWEHWDGIKPDGSMWSPDMNSFNHYAYGAVGEWLYRVVAGIDVDASAPGFRHSVIYPRISDRLESVKASYETIYGLIRVAWSIRGDDIKLSVTIPHNTTASIRLDKAKAVSVDAGLYFTSKDGYFEAEAGSGEYSIRFTR